MIRAFTGPSHLTPAEVRFVWETVKGLTAADRVRTGAQRGVDTEAALATLAYDPTAHQEVFVPAAPYNPEALRLPGATLSFCASAPTRAEAYRARNRDMVTGVDELVAFVHRPSFYRSGEWMTINLARVVGARLDLRLLSASDRSLA